MRTNYFKKIKLSLFFFLISILVLTCVEIFLSLISDSVILKEFIVHQDTEKNLVTLTPVNNDSEDSSGTYNRSDDETFSIVKSANTYRVFILGDATAAGWPYKKADAFPAKLDSLLCNHFPFFQFEVVNLATLHSGSFSIKDQIQFVLSNRPDLTIIYTGNNEFISPIRISRQNILFRSGLLTNLYLSLIESLTYRKISDLINSMLRSDQKSVPTDLYYAEGFNISKSGDLQKIEYGSSIYQSGINHFYQNMNYIIQKLCDAGIKVIVCNPASNLMHRPFLSTVSDSLSPADLIYNEARMVLYRDGNANSAYRLFRRAKDLDASRLRASTDINIAVNTLAEKFGVARINTDSVFASIYKDGLPNERIFYDHVHPNLLGHKIIADLCFSEIVKDNYLKHLLSRREEK